MIGHVSPEAAVGGPIAAIRDGDVVEIDTDANRLSVKLSRGELAKRLAGWSAPPPKYTAGVFAKYAALVTSAAEGAVTVAFPAAALPAAAPAAKRGARAARNVRKLAGKAKPAAKKAQKAFATAVKAGKGKLASAKKKARGMPARVRVAVGGRRGR
jgi:hypothetical protein